MWIWTAVNRDSRKIIDFQIGNRSTKTFRKLWKRIARISCGQYFSDNWHAYRELLPKSKHVASKSETCLVESKNSQIRNYGSRFKRKTKRVSKKMIFIYYEMLSVVNKINQIAEDSLNKKVKLN